MRKYKKVKRKEIIFDLDEWEQVEDRAEKMSMTTSDFIRCITEKRRGCSACRKV